MGGGKGKWTCHDCGRKNPNNVWQCGSDACKARAAKSKPQQGRGRPERAKLDAARQAVLDSIAPMPYERASKHSKWEEPPVGRKALVDEYRKALDERMRIVAGVVVANNNADEDTAQHEEEISMIKQALMCLRPRPSSWQS